MCGELSAILDVHAGIAESKGCERNPFAEDDFRPMVAYLQNLSKIEEKLFAHTVIIGSVLSDMHF